MWLGKAFIEISSLSLFTLEVALKRITRDFPDGSSG